MTAVRRKMAWGSGAACCAATVLILLVCMIPTAHAQSTLVERMRAQRLRVQLDARLDAHGLRAPVWGPADVPTAESFNPQRLFWWLPRNRAPRVELAPLVLRPLPDTAAPPPPTLDAIAWDKVPATGQEAFLDRFREALWTNEGMAFRTALDTTATPELRARLNDRFGAPTRTAVARGVEGFEGSLDVQFEYWFVVNDSIPFVALDVDGPFGKGLVLAGDLAHEAVLGALKHDLTETLMARHRLMPYVDYYRHREREQWFRTGYDGERYFVVAIERPRWARRRSGTGRWYLFR